MVLAIFNLKFNSVALFKKRLDKFWANQKIQNVMFEWTADITRTGD